MTRRRYIKLTMAQGYQRNQATAAAKLAHHLRISYQTLYTLQNVGRLARHVSQQFALGMQGLQEVAMKAGAAMREIGRRMASNRTVLDGGHTRQHIIDE